MRKVIVSEMMSLDGFFAGPNGEIDWHIVEEEFNRFAIELLDTVDALIFGRLTYQLFENYWPAAALNLSTSKSDHMIANKINEAAKIVYSKSLEKISWKNSRLLKEIIPEEIENLKQQPGKDIIIYGSGSIVSAFTRLGLIDEYKIFVNPLVLGAGKPLFAGLQDKLNLKLLGTKVFCSGIVLLDYEPVKKE